jgi:opacity protein-like surface antigen
MRKILLLSAAFAALSVAPALADDLLASPFGWSAGVFVGENWGRATTTDVDGYNGPPPFFATRSMVDFGLQGGYNWNFYDSALLGLQAEAGDLRFKTSQQYPPYIDVRLPTDSVAQASIGDYFALSAKVGYVWDAFTVYGKVGGFWSDAKQGFIDQDPAGTTLVSGTRVSQPSVNLLWGGGIDLAVSHCWSLGLEYEYFDFPNLHNIATSNLGDKFRFDHTLNDQTVKITASYHFD